MAQATFKNNEDLKGAVLEGLQEDGSSKMIFVKDQGVYLMGSGDQKPEHVLYVRGLDPSKNEDWYDKAWSSYGGDDFGEFIDLRKPEVDAIIDGIITKIVIKLTATTLSWTYYQKKAA